MGSITTAINHGNGVIVPYFDKKQKKVVELLFSRGMTFSITDSEMEGQFSRFPEVEIKKEVEIESFKLDKTKIKKER